MLPMLPEILLITFAVGVLLAETFIDDTSRTRATALALVGVTAAGAALLFTPTDATALGGRFALDAAGWWMKFVFLAATFATVLLAHDAFAGRSQADMGMGHRGEFLSILLFTAAGMLFLVSARDLVTLYISLELATIPLYALVAWRREARTVEAGLKYLVSGALASAFLLYGMGVIYGLSGTTTLAALGAAARGPALWLAIGCITAGIGFKLTLFPYHFWSADVYEGAPLPVATYLSVASKAAGLVLMLQLFSRLLGGEIVSDLGLFIAGLAAATMTVGNLAAIVQRNLKRFMAFSAVSQAGYLLLGFLGTGAHGQAAMVFYTLVYAATNLAAFAVVALVANHTGVERIEAFKGFSRTNPLLALAMMTALFSLAGIPPLAGFVGKFFLFSAASGAGYHWLVAVAAVNSTVSLYYYLRIVREMYIEPAGVPTPVLKPGFALSTLVLVTGLATVALGIVPSVYETILRQIGG